MLSRSAQKRRFEIFSLTWSILWIALVAVIVALRLFESFTEWHYLAVGLLMAVVPVGFPIIFAGDETKIPLSQRYSTKVGIYSQSI